METCIQWVYNMKVLSYVMDAKFDKVRFVASKMIATFHICLFAFKGPVFVFHRRHDIQKKMGFKMVQPIQNPKKTD